MKRILVTAANGDIGDAIARIIDQCWPGWSIHGADSAASWPADQLFEGKHHLPHAHDPLYISELRALADRLSTDLVIPVSEPELLRISENRGSLESVPLLMNDPRIVRLFLDKQATADWLRENGLPAPFTIPIRSASLSDLPVIAKSRSGYGNRGYEVIRTAQRLAVAQAELPKDWIAQELLEPEENEFTCTILRIGGEVRTIILKRDLDGSNTVRAEVREEPVIDELLRAIADHAQLNGSINVQLKLTESGPFIFEINPRFSGTVMMRHLIGFQDLHWSLSRMIGNIDKLPEFDPPYGYQVFRKSREIVLPPDDG